MSGKASPNDIFAFSALVSTPLSKYKSNRNLVY